MWFNRWALIGAACWVLGAGAARAAFVPGDLYYLANNKIVRIPAGGGDLTSAVPLATLPSISIGQMAFDADLGAMYVTQFNTGQVLRVTSDGQVSTFATGVSGACGVLRLHDGRLLATEFGGAVIDVSAGGNFGSAKPFATGFNTARGLFERSDGHVLLTAQNAGKVYDITAGGNFSSATPLRSGLGPVAYLADGPGGRLLASQLQSSPVVDLATGASPAPVYATGQAFMGLAADGMGTVYASVMSGVNSTTGMVFRAESGGTFTSSMAYARGLPGGESSVAIVPAPEPSLAGVTVAMIAVMAVLRRRRRTRGCRRLV